MDHWRASLKDQHMKICWVTHYWNTAVFIKMLALISVLKLRFGLTMNPIPCPSPHLTSHSLPDGSRQIWFLFLNNNISEWLNKLIISVSLSSWNEWISLPMKYCDLPRNSQLCLTIYECCGPGKYVPVGGTTLPLFGKLGVYKQVTIRWQFGFYRFTTIFYLSMNDC